MRAPTGSRVHRFVICPASAVLPAVLESDRDEDERPMAGRGRAIHDFLAVVDELGYHAAIARVADPATRELCSLIDLDDLPRGIACEVAIAYDWRARTARELARGVDRPYATPGLLELLGVAPLGPTEIGMTLDLVGHKLVGGQRIGYVGDLKTGQGRLPPPDRYGQTVLGALAASRVYGWESVVVELLFVRDDGRTPRSRGYLDAIALEDYATQLERAFERAAEFEQEVAAVGALDVIGAIDVVEGTHCAHCPALARCPAKIGLARGLPEVLRGLGIEPAELRVEEGAEAAKLVPVPRQELVGPEEVARGWILTERLDDLVKRLREELAAYVDRVGDVPLPDGRVLGRVERTAAKYDGRVAATVLREWFGDAAAERAVSLSVTKEAIEEEARRAIADGTAPAPADGKRAVLSSKHGTGVLDRLLDEMARRGGKSESTTYSIRAHAPRRSRGS